MLRLCCVQIASSDFHPSKGRSGSAISWFLSVVETSTRVTFGGRSSSAGQWLGSLTGRQLRAISSTRLQLNSVHITSMTNGQQALGFSHLDGCDCLHRIQAGNGAIDLTLLGFVLNIGAILRPFLSRLRSTERLVDRLRGKCFDDEHRVLCSVGSVSNLMISGPALAYRRRR